MYALLFVFSIAVLAPGIHELTGVTGKDEYLLGLRTPMQMLEQDVWLVPWLDGAPRLQKPPLVYWLGRASFEAFGPSLVSGRALGVVFGALLVLGVALIGRELTGDPRYGLFAGLVALSSAGVAVDARRLMLDLPVAAFATLAIYFFLRWRGGAARFALPAAAAMLAAGFLSKGPAVLIPFAAAVFAFLLTDRASRAQLRAQPGALVAALGLFLVLSLPWFWYVHQLFPDTSQRIASEQVEARRFLEFSLSPLLDFVLIGLPWSLVAVAVLVVTRAGTAAAAPERARLTTLALWLALTLLPFLMFRTFGRYLYGALVPMALLAAMVLRVPGGRGARVAARCGLLLVSVLAGLFAGAVWWFRGFAPALIVLVVAYGFFIVVWWRARAWFAMAVAAALVWTCLIGLVYPRLGINAIPERLLAAARERAVILYDGPQPALLPIALGRGLFQTNDLRRAPATLLQDCRGFLVFVPEESAPRVQGQLHELAFDYEVRDRYRALSARGSWIRFTRPGVTGADWRAALRTRDLDALGVDIVMYAARSRACADA